MFPALDKTPLGSFDPVFENIDVDFAPSELQAFLLDKSNSNLSSAQKELLLIHWKSGHTDMRRLQTMMHPTKALDSSDSRLHLSPPVVFKTKFATILILDCSEYQSGPQKASKLLTKPFPAMFHTSPW